jgi:RNA polymerase sigma-70 factor (ECF subfamily)
VDYLQYVTKIDLLDFRKIMEEHGQEVWNYAYFLTKRKELADDVAQDTFIKAYRNIASFRGESSVRTWLLKITRNTAYDYKHTSFFRKVILMDMIQDKQTVPSAEHEYFQIKYKDDIWLTVLALPIKLREVLLLDAYYQMDMIEIALTLNIALGTVKSRLHRARRKVAKQLENAEGLSHE